MNKIPYYQDYVDFLEKNEYGKTTVVAYSHTLKTFNHFLIGGNLDIEKINLYNIDQFIDKSKEKISAKKRKTSTSTINLYLSCLKSYFNFLKKYKNYSFEFETSDIKQIKQAKQPARQVNLEEIKSIISKITEQRDYIMIQLIMQTGIRVSDLVEIKKEEIIGYKLKIRNNEYMLDHKLVRLIAMFKNKSQNQSEYLFVSQSLDPNYQTKGKHLPVRTIEKIFRKYFISYNYNDLRLLHYRSLCEELPNILNIHHHEIGNEIKLQDIQNII